MCFSDKLILLKGFLDFDSQTIRVSETQGMSPAERL